ncbi:MAG: FAD-binding oxidoreductase [Hyphomicrobium sp.]
MTTKQNHPDAVVIGAGIVGCGIAHALSLRGLHVALIDRGDIGQGTSGNTFAWVNATSKVNDEAYFQLNARGAALYRELACEWGERRIGLHPNGMIEWCSPADQAQLDALRARADKLKAWGYPIGWLGRGDLVAMEPHVRFEEGAEGLHAFADTSLDVPTFLRFIVERLRANGAVVLEHSGDLELIADDDGKVLGLETEGGRLHTERVVVATGPDTPEVLSALTGHEGFSSRFPMQRAPGLLVRTPPGNPRRLVRHVLYAANAGIHIQQTPDGGYLMGSDGTDGLVSEDRSQEKMHQAAHELLERTQRLIPSFEGTALLDRCELGIGVRPVPTDEKSIAGPMPGADGLYITVTHSGVTLALVLGKLMAECIDTGAVPAQLAPFGFERFQ